MKIRTILLTVILTLALGLGPALLPGQAPTAQAQSDYITVVVKEGESLATYATIYGVSGWRILAVNPQIKDPHLIYPGDVITIPVVKTFTPSLSTPFYYTVQAGDNLYSIARRFELVPNAIVRANSLKTNIVKLGATYIMPAGPHQYYAQRNDTADTIADRYGSSTEAVVTANNLASPTALYVGQLVYIPTVYDSNPIAVPPTPTPIPTNTPTLTPVASQTPLPTLTPAKSYTPWPTYAPYYTATPIPSPTPNLTPVPGQYIYTVVREGDNFVTYTYRYGVSGWRIIAANPQVKNPDIIYAGEVILIPVLASFTPSRTTPFFYVVQPNEMLYTLADKFELNALVLNKANPDATFLPGTTILIPAGPHVYTVKKGDELRYIAAKYGCTVEFLLTGNHMDDPNKIYDGQQIFIPIRYNAPPMPFTP